MVVSGEGRNRHLIARGSLAAQEVLDGGNKLS
jgi:hypothetical protein